MLRTLLDLQGQGSERYKTYTNASYRNIMQAYNDLVKQNKHIGYRLKPVKSLDAVHQIIKNLEKNGFVEKDERSQVIPVEERAIEWFSSLEEEFGQDYTEWFRQ